MKVKHQTYSVKVKLAYVDFYGHTNSYYETLAICTNLNDAESISKAVSNAFIIEQF